MRHSISPIRRQNNWFSKLTPTRSCSAHKSLLFRVPQEEFEGFHPSEALLAKVVEARLFVQDFILFPLGCFTGHLANWPKGTFWSALAEWRMKKNGIKVRPLGWRVGGCRPDINNFLCEWASSLPVAGLPASRSEILFFVYLARLGAQKCPVKQQLNTWTQDFWQ